MRDVEGGSTEPRRELDLRGLRCPLPVLKIARALRALEHGDELTALTDDPLAVVDVPNLVRETRDELISATRAGAALIFRIRKGGFATTP